MVNANCKRFDTIQNDMLNRAFSFYDQGKDINFWAEVEALQKLLDLKYSLDCGRKLRKKKK